MLADRNGPAEALADDKSAEIRDFYGRRRLLVEAKVAETEGFEPSIQFPV
jgi:hypothetical protein